MKSCIRRGRGRASEQEGARLCPRVVNGVADDVPGRGQPLPLIEQNRRLSLEESGLVGFDQAALLVIVEPIDRPSPLECRRRLSDGFRALDRDRGQAHEELVELVVNDTPRVGDRAVQRFWSTHVRWTIPL